MFLFGGSETTGKKTNDEILHNNRCGVYTCLYKITMPSSADITGMMGIVRAITPKCLYDDSHDRMNKSFLSSHIYIYTYIYIFIYI